MKAKYKVSLKYKNNFRSDDLMYNELPEGRNVKFYKKELSEIIKERPFTTIGEYKKINLSPDNGLDYTKPIKNKNCFQNTMDNTREEIIRLFSNEEVILDYVIDKYFLDKTMLVWKTCSCPNNAGLYQATFTFLGEL